MHCMFQPELKGPLSHEDRVPRRFSRPAWLGKTTRGEHCGSIKKQIIILTFFDVDTNLRYLYGVSHGSTNWIIYIQ